MCGVLFAGRGGSFGNGGRSCADNKACGCGRLHDARDEIVVGKGKDSYKNSTRVVKSLGVTLSQTREILSFATRRCVCCLFTHSVAVNSLFLGIEILGKSKKRTQFTTRANLAILPTMSRMMTTSQAEHATGLSMLGESGSLASV